MASTENIPETPTLPQKHSGIPSRLLHKATKAKELIYQTRTSSNALNNTPQLPVLPQGVSRKGFETAIAELSSQLGDDNVSVIDKPPKEDGWYMEHPTTHDMMSVIPSDQFMASALTYPGSTADVQTIVLWANKHSIPLFPISMGRNLGYGGAAPRVRGSVVVDLGRRMNKILDIDPEDYTCLVEPGVSFYALYEEVQRRGYTHMWIDTPDLGGGSVLGNTLDRGVGYTPYGDHWAMHSGLEVVLPTGEVVRTGMGALPANNTWQTFPYGFGPYLDGMFSQSNLGIVTKMGMTLMPAPPDYESFMYTFAKEDDLAQIVEIIRPLRISMILENAAQLRSAEQTLAVQGAPRTDFWTGKGRIPTEVVEAETAKLPCGKCAWIYYGMAYGPQHIRKYKLDIIDAEFNKVPGCKKIDPATIPEDNYFWSRDKIARGETDLEELLWCNWVPNGSHIAFSPVSPIRGKDARALYALARRMQEENNIDAMFPAFIVGLREMHLIVEIVFNKHDPEDSANALKAMRGMVDEAARLGYGEYRTHLALMDQVAGTYCWNDNAIMKLNERIKDALDPRGILAPGKSGVWPERYRGRGWEMDIGREERSEGHGVAHGGSEARL